MLRLGQKLGAMLDEADEVVKGMGTMQTMLTSILEDRKAGNVQPDEVVITRNQQGQVVKVDVVETEDESDES